MEKWLTKDDIEKMFPEIKEIEDERIQEQCKEAFVAAYKEGNWSKEEAFKLPVSLKKVERQELNNQIEHVRVVTKIAKEIYDSLEDTYKQENKIRDYVIAGALLHDLGKMIEFTLKEGKLTYSDNANIIRHPLSGAIIAAKIGLPDEIVHIIATHSFEGKDSYHSLASIIVNQADEVAFKYITYFNKK